MINRLNDKNPFKVPDNYFEEVNKRIISATTGSEQASKKVSIYRRLRTSLLIAASVAGFIMISYTAIKLVTHDRTNSQVSEALHEMNPESYINDIDISALEEDASSLVLSEEGPDVSKKDIIDYLMLNNIELSEIYERQ